MTPEDAILMRLFLLMIVLIIAGIAIEHYWPQVRDYLARKLTRRRMARYMNHRSQWGHVWHRRRM